MVISDIPGTSALCQALCKCRMNPTSFHFYQSLVVSTVSHHHLIEKKGESQKGEEAARGPELAGGRVRTETRVQ